MAVKTYRLGAGLDGVWGALSESDVTAANRTSPEAWLVAKQAAGNTGHYRPGAQVTSADFGAVETGFPAPLLQFSIPNAFRTPAAISGTFAATDWTFTFAVRATVASSQRGRMRLRVYRSVNSDGTGATELTSAAQVGTTSLALSTTADVTSVITWSPGTTFTLSGEYLFFVIAWAITTAGGSNSANVVMRTGQSAGGSRFVTPDLLTAQTVAVGKKASSTTVRGVTPANVVQPLYTDLIDDFNRADGSVLAGVGAGIWAANALFTAGQEALISGNQLAVPRNWDYLLTRETFGADADLVVECVDPGTGAISFAMCALETGSATCDALAVDWNSSNGGTWMWTQIINGGSNSQGLTTGLPGPAAGDTFWMSKRAHVFRLYRKPAGGVYTEVFPSKTYGGLVSTQGAMGIAIRDSTARWDNFSGGPRVLPVGRVASPYLTSRDDYISNINFGWTNTHAVGQGFKAKQNLLTEVSVILSKLGTPTVDVIVEVQGSSSGRPNGVVVGTVGTVLAGSLTGGFLKFTLPCSVPLTQDLDYFIVLRSASPYNAINNYPLTSGLTGILFEGYGYSTTQTNVDTWNATSANSLTMTMKFGGQVKGVTPYIPPPITATVGKVATATWVGGTTPSATGVAPIPVGKRVSTSIVKGVTLAAGGAAPVSIGRKAAATTVRGATLVPLTVSVTIGRGGGGTTVRGMTLVEQLATPVSTGRRAAATTVRGITLAPGVKAVPIGKVLLKPPTPVAPVVDDFNRADGALGANWGGTTQFGSGLSVIRNNQFGTPAATGNSNGSSYYTGQVLTGHQQLRVDLATITAGDPGAGRIWLVMINDPMQPLSPGFALDITPTSIDNRASWNLYQYDIISGQNYITSGETPAGQGFVGGETLTFSWVNGRLIFEKTVGGVTTTLMNERDNTFIPPTQGRLLYHVLRTQRTNTCVQTLDNYGGASLSGQVRGVTPSGTGAVPIPVGKRASASIVKGVTLAPVGTVPLAVGRKISATAVRGVSVLPSPVSIPIGKVGGAVAAPFPSFSGLDTRLDASALGLADGAAVSAWPNLGGGAAPSVVGAPAMTVKAGATPTGKPVVRFTYAEGRLRSAWSTGVRDYTVLYIMRQWGYNLGRAFSAQYPPSNFLIGTHTSLRDTMYDNGSWIYGPATDWATWINALPGPWRMYEADSADAEASRFFIDGALIGSGTVGGLGLTGGWGLSGYGPGVEESLDIDIAEVVVYNRKLSNVERVAVESYLQDKWITGSAAPAGSTVRGVALAPGAAPISIGKVSPSTQVQAVKVRPLGGVPVPVGRCATATVARGVVATTGIVAVVGRVIGGIVADERMLAATAPTSGDPAGGTLSLGAKFDCTADGLITHVRYWAYKAATYALSVWDTATQVKLATVSDDAPAAGWREIALSTPLNIVAGKNYSVTAFRNNGFSMTSGQFSPPTFASHLSNYRSMYTNAAVDAFPTLLGNHNYHVDVVYHVGTGVVRGIGIAPSGTVPVAVGKRISTATVKGVTLVPGVAPVAVGKRTAATTTRGVTFVGTGVAPLAVGRKASATSVPGISVTGMPPQFVPIGKVGGFSMLPETSAYFAATGLDPLYSKVVNDLVAGLKTYGLWTKMRALYPFVGGTEELHKWNLKDPRDLDAAYRLTYNAPGASFHSLLNGYQPNVAPDYSYGLADTHLIPAGTLDPASVHMSLYSLTTLGTAPRCDMGNYNWGGGGGRFHLIIHYTSGEFYYSLGHNGTPNVAGGDGHGLFVSSRTAVDSEVPYKDGASIGGNAAAPNALPPASIFIGGLNGYPREYSDTRFGFASIGDGLSAQNVADLNTIVQAYQVALRSGPVTPPVVTPTSTVRGIGLVAGAAPIAIGKRTPATVARGITVSGSGVALLPVGKKAAASLVKGVTLAPVGAPVVTVGKKGSATTVKGVSIAATGTVPLAVGRATPFGLGPDERMLADTGPQNLRVADPWTNGATFTVGSNGTITHIRYYAAAAGPYALSLWDSVGTRIRAISDTSTGTGWREVPLSTPLPVSAGSTYTVSYDGDNDCYSIPTPASLSSNLTNYIGVYILSADSFPSQYANGYYYHIDVVYHVGTAAQVKGVTLTPSGAAPVVIGKRTAAPVVRGVTLAPAGAAPIPVGKRQTATITRGVTILATGTAPVSIGKRASATTVRGVTLLGTGTVPFGVGRVAKTTTVSGVFLLPTGSAPVGIGRVQLRTVVYGVLLVGAIVRPPSTTGELYTESYAGRIDNGQLGTTTNTTDSFGGRMGRSQIGRVLSRGRTGR